MVDRIFTLSRKWIDHATQSVVMVSNQMIASGLLGSDMVQCCTFHIVWLLLLCFTDHLPSALEGHSDRILKILPTLDTSDKIPLLIDTAIL